MHYRTWFSFLVLCAWASAGAGIEPGTETEPSTVLELKSARPNITLGGHWFAFEDVGGALEFETVAGPESRHRFRRVVTDDLNLGFTDSHLWLRIDLMDPGPGSRDWTLEIPYPLLDELRVYRGDGAGGWRESVLGDQLPFASRPLPHRNFLVPLRLLPGEPERLYLRIASTSSMQVRPLLHPALEFFLRTNREEVFFGVVYGVMLMMALYNGFLFFAVRDPAYLTYVLAVLAGTAFIATINGHAYQYLWPTKPGWANTVAPLSAALWIVGTAVFTRLFLETRRYAPLMHRLIEVMILVSIGAVALALWADYRIAVRIVAGLGLANGLLILATSVVCWVRGNRAARFFIWAWVAYAAGTTILIVNRLGGLPYNFVTQHSATLGLLVEIVVLSMALSDKYRLMTEQLRDHSRSLEAKVEARTAELREANAKLSDLAQRDPLTRLANRRRFDHSLEAEWERHRRERDPIGLLLIDVDDFKGYNDHFGHRQGDHCLRTVAESLAQTLRRPADLAARYGGDEFAAVLPDTDLAGVLVVAERLRAALRRAALPHAPGARHPMVTLSIGAAGSIPGPGQGRETLFEQADAALYRAKDGGRDRVAGGPV